MILMPTLSEPVNVESVATEPLLTRLAVNSPAMGMIDDFIKPTDSVGTAPAAVRSEWSPSRPGYSGDTGIGQG